MLPRARNEDDVTQIEVVRRDEDGHHLTLAVLDLDDDVAGDETERVLALARMLDQHHGAEGAPALGRE